jgi:nucleoid-associated protein YgaU
MRGILALGIIVGGIALATAFGRPDPSAQPGSPGHGDPVTLRRRATTTAAESANAAARAGLAKAPLANVTRFPGSRESTAVVEAEKSDVLPPTLAKSFPAIESPVSARWGVSMDAPLSVSGGGRGRPRVHKIVDGDTLPGLAARYLGNAARANEFFEANRDLLSSPDALPIGIELKIPPRETPVRDLAESARQPALVPISPRDPGQQGSAPSTPSR